MIEQIMGFLTSLIIQVIQSTGYFGIFLLMTAESALIPIPSEVTMPFAGYLASTGQFNIYAVILTGAFANLVGSLIAYYLGFWGEDAFVRQLIRKYGKWILITVHEYDHAERWFRKYGERIVFISRILPIIRTFISLPAGVAKMNLRKFIILTFVGSLIWSAFLTYIGVIMGKNWNSIEVYYRKFEYVIVGAAILLAGYYTYHKWRRLSHRS